MWSRRWSRGGEEPRWNQLVHKLRWSEMLGGLRRSPWDDTLEWSWGPKEGLMLLVLLMVELRD